MTQSEPKTFWSGWHERIRALRNVPTLLGIVWESGPGVVSGVATCRITSALIPIAMLTVTKRILDAIQAKFSGAPLPSYFWGLVALEFGLAAFASVLGG